MNAARYLSTGLAVVGLYIAGYFTLVYYGLLKAETSLMPRVCRLEERTCKSVLDTRYARLFGVPNSLLGVVYYVAVMALLVIVGTVGPAIVVVAWLTVAVGIFLLYALFFIIKIPCPLCLAGHTINLLLAMLLTAMLR